jgi:hypothetical protein
VMAACRRHLYAEFDSTFIPIDGPARRARRAMISRMCIEVQGRKFLRPPDPFEVEELQRQERTGQADLEAFRAIFGNAADWLTALCFEAKYGGFTQGEAANEVGRLMARAAADGDHAFFSSITRAMKRVKDTIGAGPENLPKLIATHFGIHYREKHGVLPTRAVVKHLLEEQKMLPNSLSRSNHGANDGRFFSGPFLSQFPCGKPWETSQQ